MPTKRPTRRRRPAPTPTASAGFAEAIRDIISGRNLTAYFVARSAGVAPSVVSRFLSRERGLSLETFDLIAGALGLRLVETGRGRGRPSKPAGPARPRADAPEHDGPGDDPADVGALEAVSGPS